MLPECGLPNCSPSCSELAHAHVVEELKALPEDHPLEKVTRTSTLDGRVLHAYREKFTQDRAMTDLDKSRHD